MTKFVLIHGAADSGWAWHLVTPELDARGHDVVAPDLPCEDDDAGFPEYANVVIAAVGDQTDLIVVGHSLGGYTATLVADRLPARGLVLLTAMIPAPGESANDWWANTGFTALRDDAETDEDGGPVPESDQFYNDVPPELATEATRHARGQSGAPMAAAWPLTARPGVPTRFILCTNDRFFSPAFMRRVVAERLGIEPDELAAGHCAMLSRPGELAELLDRYATEFGPATRD